MAISSSTSVFIISLLGIPITYSVNLASTLKGEATLFIVGTVSLTAICVLTYFLTHKKDQPTDPLYYVLTITTFACVVDLIIGLENDGIIKGFMTTYLKNGEPYLTTPYGTMICYWDGIAHYSLNLMMLAALAWNQNYRSVGLYWAGSIGHSMVVFMPGNVLGKYGLRWSFLLNLPYCFIPFMCAARFLMERPHETQSKEEARRNYTSILQRPIDILMFFGLLASAIVAVFRGFAVLGCHSELMETYLKEYEPYLTEPNTYPKFQMLIYLFYYVPYYIMAIYGLLYPGCSWMPDWALLHAGAAAQGQFSHIGGAVHYRTPYILRASMDPRVSSVFWLINAGLFVFPQIFAFRCVTSQAYFTPRDRKMVTIQEKKDN